jgi:hypothetical protein
MPTRSRVRSGLCAGRTRARCATRQSRSRVACSGKDIGGYSDPRNKADLNEICSCASRCAATPHAYKRKGKAMQTTAALVVRDDGLIRRITLSNGACRNPLSSKLISELRSVLVAAGNIPQLRVIILAAEGPARPACVPPPVIRSKKAAGSRDKRSTPSYAASLSCVIANWMTRLSESAAI